MIVDKEIEIFVKSSNTIYKLGTIDIGCKMGDIVTIPIERLWLGSNIKINVVCDVCGFIKILQYSLYNKNVKKHNIYCCSNKCSSIKNKLTCLKKYGVENFNNREKSDETKLNKYGDKNFNNREKSDETKLNKYGDKNFNNKIKTRMTNQQRYGVDCILLSENIKDKIKETNILKYGVEDSRSSHFVKNKRSATNIERYGVDNYSKTKEYLEKVKKTSFERYGVDSPNKSDSIKSKKVISMLLKYGFISNSMTDESKNRLKQTNMIKYGVEYPMQVLEFSEKQQKNAKKIEYYNDNLYYQGSYEKHFLDYMSSAGLIDFIQRGFAVKYDFEGKQKLHYPDFFIEKYNLIVEIKSSYYYNLFLEKNIAKKKTCINLGYNYLFIVNKNYTVLDAILKNNSI